MKRILIFITFTFLKPASSSVLGISTSKLSWNKSLGQNKDLLSKKYIETNGWDSVKKTHLQVNESYWIGARGDYTDYVSWEGCIERNDSLDIKRDCHLTKYEDSGSVSKCLDNCKSDYFALLGDVCFCVSEKQRRDCMHLSSKDCGNQCLENPNDFCGAHKDVMTLYNKEKPDNLNFNKSIRYEEDCLVLAYERQRPAYKLSNCASHGRRYICNGPNGTHPENHGSLITWRQAFDLCRKNVGSMHYNMSYKENVDNTYVWTSLRRSLDLIWTTNTDGSKQCAALSKKRTSALVVTLEDCKKELRYIYVHDQKGGSSEDCTCNSNTQLIILLIIVSSGLATVVGGVCFFRLYKKRLCSNERRATDEAAEPAVVFNVYAEPETIYNTTMKVPQSVNRNYDKVTSDDVIRNGGYDVANYKGSLKPSIHISGYGFGIASGKTKAPQTDDN